MAEPAGTGDARLCLGADPHRVRLGAGVVFELADEFGEAADALTARHALAVELDVAVTHPDADVEPTTEAPADLPAAAATRAGRWYGASSIPVASRSRCVTASPAAAAVSRAGQ